MKKQITAKLLTTIFTTLAIFGAFSSAYAQKKGAITEAEVKAYFTDWWTHDCDKSDDCKRYFRQRGENRACRQSHFSNSAGHIFNLSGQS